MADRHELLTDFADKLASRSAPKKRQRGPVIMPPGLEHNGSAEGEGYTVYPDFVNVMSPESISIHDSNARTDLSGFPEKIAEVLRTFVDEPKSMSIDYDDSVESREIVDYVENNAELQETVEKLASVTETKLDGLTDTVESQSKRQLDVMMESSKLLTDVRDTERESLEYTKERDFDLDQKAAGENVNNPDTKDIPQEEKQRNPFFQMPFGMGGLGGLLGGFGEGGKARGILGILGKALRIVTVVGAGFLLVSDVLRQFFGIDLIQMVSDGFSYITDNWDNLGSIMYDKIGEMFDSLPGMFGNMIREVGTFIREIFTSMLDLVPGFKMLREATGGIVENILGEENAQAVQSVMDSGTGLVALGAAGVAGTIGTRKYLQGRQNARPIGDEAPTQKPSPASPDSPAKKGIFSKLRGAMGGKVGMLLTGLSLLPFLSDDEDEQPTLENVSESPDIELAMPETDESNYAAYGTAAAAGALALNPNARQFATDRFTQVRDRVVPTNKPPAINTPALPVDADFPKESKWAKVRKGLGRIPGLSLLYAGADIYGTATDDTLTDEEKNIQYAGAGGSLAGGAAGAALGASLGSVIPGFGTAIGGIAGGLLGAVYGEEAVEGLVSDWFSSDAPSDVKPTSPDTSFQDREFAEIEKSINDAAKQADLMDDAGNIVDGSAKIRNGQVVSRKVDSITTESLPTIESSGNAVEEVSTAVRTLEDAHFAQRSKNIDALKKEQEERRNRIYISDYYAVEDEIIAMHKNSGGSISLTDAEKVVRKKYGFSPEPSGREYDLSTGQPVTSFKQIDMQNDIIEGFENTYQDSIEPDIKSSSPMVSSVLPEKDVGNMENTQTRLPDVNVTVEQPKVEEKSKPKSVQATARKAKSPTMQGSGPYRDVPSLNNVPILVDDGTFNLISLGYL